MSLTKNLVLLIAVSLSPQALLAHEIPIHPVEIKLKVYPTWIHMYLDTNQCYWSAEVLHLPKAPDTWQDSFNDRVKRYVGDHFKLSVDGIPLESRLLGGRYVQEPWQDSLSARFLMEFSYMLPPQRGQRLAGNATFFNEHAAEDKDETYLTRLDIPGRSHLKYSLTLDAPRFDVSLDDASRTRFQEHLDFLWDQFMSKVFAPLTVVVILAVLYFAVGGWQRRGIG